MHKNTLLTIFLYFMVGVEEDCQHTGKGEVFSLRGCLGSWFRITYLI